MRSEPPFATVVDASRPPRRRSPAKTSTPFRGRSGLGSRGRSRTPASARPRATGRTAESGAPTTSSQASTGVAASTRSGRGRHRGSALGRAALALAATRLGLGSPGLRLRAGRRRLGLRLRLGRRDWPPAVGDALGPERLPTRTDVSSLAGELIHHQRHHAGDDPEARRRQRERIASAAGRVVDVRALHPARSPRPPSPESGSRGRCAPARAACRPSFETKSQAKRPLSRRTISKRNSLVMTSLSSSAGSCGPPGRSRARGRRERDGG